MQVGCYEYVMIITIIFVFLHVVDSLQALRAC